MNINAPNTPMPSGPDGDYIEADLERPSRGAMRASVKLLPLNGIIRIFPQVGSTSAGQQRAFVRFRHMPTTSATRDSSFTICCLHEYDIAASSSDVIATATKKAKQSCSSAYFVSFQGPGGANISTLRSHAETHFQSFFYKKAPLSKPMPVVPGQKGMLTFFKPKIGQPASLTSIPTTPGLNRALSITVNTTDPVLEPQIAWELCNGIHFSDLTLPKNVSYPTHYSFLRHYPTIIHEHQKSDVVGSSKIDWTFNSIGMIKSNKCTGRFSTIISKSCDVEMLLCVECSKLDYNPKLKNVIMRSIDSSDDVIGSSKKINDRFSSVHDLINKNKVNKESSTKFWFAAMNNLRNNTRLNKRNSDITRVTEALSMHDVPSLRNTLAHHLGNKKSYPALLEKIKRATETVISSNGNYRNQFKSRKGGANENEFSDNNLIKIQLSFLMWKLGCGRLLKTNAITNGGYSKRTIRNRIKDGTIEINRFAVTHTLNDLGEQAIRENMFNALFSDSAKKTLPNSLVGVVIMYDGIAVDPRLSLDSSQLPHQISGVCRHCKCSSLISYDDYLSMYNCLHAEESDPQKVHVASECEVVAIGFIGDKEHTAIIPVAMSPTCKKDIMVQESTNSIQWILDIIIKCYYDNKGPSKIGPLITLVSDGASHFSLAGGGLMSRVLPLPILNVLLQCPLFNTTGSSDGCTRSCDWDHVGKRTRERIKSLKGMKIGLQTFKKTNLAVYLKFAGICISDKEVDALLNSMDAMDVYEMVLCMQAIAMFHRVPFEAYDHSFRADVGNNSVFLELRLLGNIFHCTAVLLIGHETPYETKTTQQHLSLSELLVVASTLSHLLFSCYRKNRSNFMANQNYRHWQDTIKSLFVSMVMHQHHKIRDYWWFLDSSKRLEQFFGILRSMRGGDLNFNVSGLKERITDAAAIAQIYAARPEWDTISRKLHASHDRKNVRSWTGDTDTTKVSVVQCWLQGRATAIRILRASKAIDESDFECDALALNSNLMVDMLRPHGISISVQAGGGNANEENEEED